MSFDPEKKKNLEKMSVTIRIRTTKIFCLEKWNTVSGVQVEGNQGRRKDDKESNLVKVFFLLWQSDSSPHTLAYLITKS